MGSVGEFKTMFLVEKYGGVITRSFEMLVRINHSPKRNELNENKIDKKREKYGRKRNMK